MNPDSLIQIRDQAYTAYHSIMGTCGVVQGLKLLVDAYPIGPETPHRIAAGIHTARRRLASAASYTEDGSVDLDESYRDVAWFCRRLHEWLYLPLNDELPSFRHPDMRSSPEWAKEWLLKSLAYTGPTNLGGLFFESCKDGGEPIQPDANSVWEAIQSLGCRLEWCPEWNDFKVVPPAKEADA